MRKVKLSDANDLLLVPNPVSGHWPLTVWLWSPHYLYQSIQPQIMSISPLLMMITDLMMQSYRNTSLSLEPMKQEHKKKILEDWLEVYGLQYTIISALKMKRKKLEMTKIFFEVSYTDLLTWQNITLIYIYIYIYTHIHILHVCIKYYICMYVQVYGIYT